MNIDSKIEALLFLKAEPLSLRELAKLLSVGVEEVRDALGVLEEKLKERGVRLIVHEDTVALGTAPEMSEVIEGILKDELNKDLGKAALETLTIILYQGPITKSDIDYIRGVNSSFILRNLLIRGLIEREINPENKRAFLYRPTLDLLAYLGVTRVDELPEYEAVQEEIKTFQEAFSDESS